MIPDSYTARKEKPMVDQNVIDRVRENPQQAADVIAELAEKSRDARRAYKAAALEYAKSVDQEGRQTAEELAALIKEDAAFLEKVQEWRKLQAVAAMAGDPAVIQAHERQLAEIEAVEARIRERLEAKQSKAQNVAGSEELYEQALAAWEAYKEVQKTVRDTSHAVLDVLRVLIEDMIQEVEATAFTVFVDEPIREALMPDSLRRLRETGKGVESLALEIAVEAAKDPACK